MATVTKCPLKPITKSGDLGVDTVSVVDFGPCDGQCALSVLSGSKIVEGKREPVYSCSLATIAESLKEIRRRIR